MKNLKKLASLVLALVMVFSLATTAFADETTATTYTITAPSGSTRTYSVYQIFTGDYDAASGKLSNVLWGTNGKGNVGTAVTDAELKTLTDLANSADTEVLAEIEANYVDLTTTAVGTVKDGEPLTVVSGYYLIKDEGPVNAGESYSLYVVEVANNITINPKVGKVTSDKEVQEVNDSTADAATWGEAADYDVGDDVPFKLTATLPADYDRYTNGYKLTFHDTLSTGLSFNESSVVVKIGDTTLTKGTDYNIVNPGTACDNGCTFEVKFDNLKTVEAAVAGSTITVTYTAKLTEAASTGTAANTNKSNVTYTNDPNDDQAGEDGSTPEDTVVVFTYNVIVNKEDPSGAALSGAGFTLYKWDESATADANGEKWVAVGTEISGVTTFNFNKLDEGKYKLVETTVPAGYNKAADIIFTVVSTINGEELDELIVQDVTGATVNDFTITLPTGNISTDVVNKAGSVLPSTGGIGTTMFYVFGGIMVLAAVVLLVTKKRMSVVE